MATDLPAGLSPRYWRTYRPSGSINDALQAGEEWIGSWDGLGLYEGRASPGLSSSLRDIRQTEFYTGFMRSSAKITLSLGLPAGITSTNASRTSLGLNEGDAAWSCGVCGYRNGGEDGKCGLCGVGKDRIPHSRAGTPGPPAPKRTSTTDRPETPTPVVVAQTAGKDGKVACPACTFLNHGSMRTCEICSTPLPRASAASATANGSKAIAAALDDGKLDIVRLSFRKGGEKVAYAKLKSVLGQKAWERQDISNGRDSNSHDGDSGAATPRASGIDGIMQTMSLDAKNRSANVSSAFADLEVLMVRAGEMVKLAQSLNDKLSAQQRLNPPAGGAEKARQEEEATLIRTSLVQLGLPAPALTSDMVRSDREYLEGLAKELGALLTGHTGKGKAREVDGLMVGKHGRGVIGLDEVWGLWMRARGVALLSPATLISILPFLPDQTSPPIRPRTLPSGLKVLFSPTYSPPNILSRLIELLSPNPSKPDEAEGGGDITEKSLSLIEIAAYEGLAIGLAKELMEEIERLDAGAGMGIVRDDQAEQGAGGVRWYRDIITGWGLEK